MNKREVFILSKILKRVNVAKDLNEKIKYHAESSGMSHQEFIEHALEEYIEFLEHPRNEEDIYTLRMNEMSVRLERLEVTILNGLEQVKDSLDITKMIASGGSYLNDES